MIFDTVPLKRIDSYNGNTKLKKAGISLQYTREQVEEIIKCKHDPIYFIRNYVKIVNLDKGLMNFEMYPFQEEMIRNFHDNRFVICLLPRQSGKSISVAAYLLHEVIFNEEFQIAVLSNKGKSSKSILSKIKRMFEELPIFLKPGVVEWNKESFELSNGNVIQSASTNSSSVRGESVNLLYLDEFAHVQNADEFYASTYPVISSGLTTKVIITSTPFGMNLFYKIWTEAEKKRNGFTAIQFHWWDHPLRDEAWKEETLKNITEEQFNQEFLCVDYFSKITISDEIVQLSIPIGELFELMGGVSLQDYKYNDIENIEELCMGKQGVIYRIERSDGLSYIGITVDLQKRLTQHRKSRRFVDYDIHNVYILLVGDYLECLMREQEFIAQYDTYKNGLNMTPSGKGLMNTEKFNTFGLTHSDVTKEKMRESKKELLASGWKPNIPVFSDQTKERLSKLRKGKRWCPLKISLEIRKEIRQIADSFEITPDILAKYCKKSQKLNVLNGEINLSDAKSGNGVSLTRTTIIAKELAPLYNITSAHVNNILTKRMTEDD